MIIDKNELKIYYEGELNEKLDLAIEKTLKAFGFTRWASGYDIEENIRDLAFCREGD